MRQPHAQHRHPEKTHDEFQGSEDPVTVLSELITHGDKQNSDDERYHRWRPEDLNHACLGRGVFLEHAGADGIPEDRAADVGGNNQGTGEGAEEGCRNWQAQPSDVEIAEAKVLDRIFGDQPAVKTHHDRHDDDEGDDDEESALEGLGDVENDHQGDDVSGEKHRAETPEVVRRPGQKVADQKIKQRGENVDIH